MPLNKKYEQWIKSYQHGFEINIIFCSDNKSDFGINFYSWINKCEKKNYRTRIFKIERQVLKKARKLNKEVNDLVE